MKTISSVNSKDDFDREEGGSGKYGVQDMKRMREDVLRQMKLAIRYKR